MTTKIAVSLPDELVDAAQRAVKAGRAQSVSGYIAEAMSRREAEDDLAALLNQMDRKLGEPSAEDFAWADQALGEA